MTWSLTKVKTFEQCGAKYDYRYRQRLPDVSGPAADRGKLIHASLESFVTKDTPLTGPLEFYHGWLSNLKSQKTLEPEVTIKLALDWTKHTGTDSPWYVGVLDLRWREPPLSTIIDYKTGKIYPDHDDQKELYAVAEMADCDEVNTVKTIHTYVDKGQNREKTFTRSADFERLKTKWNSKVAAMESATMFIPNPQFLCRYCTYSRMANGGPCPF
jgi:hypothetical protein